MFAAESGSLDLVQLLLQQSGVDVNAVAGEMTALRLAVKRNDLDLVKAIINAGAEVVGDSKVRKISLCSFFHRFTSVF